ncbi:MULTISPECIES: DNA-3-methyladenine glycosylase family protein [unclassified Vibrio]|uniref:DNA-3-methyladenine glycosylase family protein n=1 Tax=unclassified Vibrio TaxID=2614977 RepID=UPI001361F473|nr:MULTISPECIES: DNA-3-methyladenine glycosylase 2 family protein [unclassified Vibrio]NAW58894.1 DNA-3-methyladenine glycosylase 2 family protein [Vibrio sp. V36_P2S2PM302]NAX26010.1 DNA-3-methyladenine glycosylase 2 family protein [Vibrio sp. V38_P2S17PM301]NAX30780.1 DNA-3-methyladenine glycosylase 2 family protein [Vibrio sp. V37_P2S8PM304]
MSDLIHQRLLTQLSGLRYLSHVVTHNGAQTIERQPPAHLLRYLSRAVAGQQLSTTAARTIWARVDQLCEIHGPLELLLVEEHHQRLRSCGLSNAKVKTLLGVNQALQTGVVAADIHHSQDADYIVSQLVQLWGIGRWTAEMALIFFFAMPDIWSEGDASLVRGLAQLAEKEDVAPETIVKAAAPYRSYLALHIWAMLDAELLKEA